MSRNISSSFFAGNRQGLVEALPSDALVVVAGHGEMQRSHDMAYDFEQEASFWYLTGLESPDWWAIIDPVTSKTTLVRPNHNDAREVFDGSLSSNEALARSGADEVFSREEALERLKESAGYGRAVYTLLPDKYVKKYSHFALNQAPVNLLRRLKRLYGEVNDCRAEVQKLRTIKRGMEIDEIKTAIGITAAAFAEASRQLRALEYEYQVEAVMTYEIRKRGGRGHAYTPIVAGGKNACTLHYVQNNARLRNSELILIDVGARSQGGYAADITRTFGVGRPSQRQRDVYDAVRLAQMKCIELIKPGLKFASYQSKTEKIMKDAVDGLNLEQAKFRNYFPHAIGHGLGIDLHDSLVGYDSFQPGMVLTVEPGIYIPEESLGVRIEDNILVTESGYDNLSKDIPLGLIGV